MDLALRLPPTLSSWFCDWKRARGLKIADCCLVGDGPFRRLVNVLVQDVWFPAEIGVSQVYAVLPFGRGGPDAHAPQGCWLPSMPGR